MASARSLFLRFLGGTTASAGLIVAIDLAQGIDFNLWHPWGIAAWSIAAKVSRGYLTWQGVAAGLSAPTILQRAGEARAKDLPEAALGAPVTTP